MFDSLSLTKTYDKFIIKIVFLGGIFMFCRHCGKEIQEGTKFCPYCGKMQEETSTTSASEQVDASFVNSVTIEEKLDRSQGALTAARVLLILNLVFASISAFSLIIASFFTYGAALVSLLFLLLPIIFNAISLHKIKTANKARDLMAMAICDIIFSGILGIVAGILMLTCKDKKVQN